MEWTGDAIILSARAHGETGAILEVLTREHGRHMGLVRGGASRRTKPLLQPGNTLHLHWRARLNEHLGSFTVELAKSRAGAILESRTALIGLNAFSAMAAAALPEREPHPPVFDVAEILLNAIENEEFAHWAPLFVRWEAGLLDELGFGLDLGVCAATGATSDLIYVSPRTGRAVSREAGAPYAGRLLALPSFLLGSRDVEIGPDEIEAGLNLTGHFLTERVLVPHGREMPLARARLNALVRDESR